MLVFDVFWYPSFFFVFFFHLRCSLRLTFRSLFCAFGWGSPLKRAPKKSLLGGWREWDTAYIQAGVTKNSLGILRTKRKWDRIEKKKHPPYLIVKSEFKSKSHIFENEKKKYQCWIHSSFDLYKLYCIYFDLYIWIENIQEDMGLVVASSAF